jgi:two-component system nitrogen regulation response regulator NtrX
MSILIVDDDLSVCQILKRILSGAGYEVIEAQDGSSGWALFEQNQIDLVLLDLQLPDEDGIELAGRMIQKNSAIPVVLISAYATVSRAVEATKIGVYDFLEKPFERDRILVTAKNALSWREMKRQLGELKNDTLHHYHMLGQSGVMQTLFEKIDRISPVDSPVLILGENGVGKELVAQAIHDKSRRAASPLVKLNCPAIPETLIESELFGHTKGAFTGAYANKSGRLKSADGGTMLLDEIGDLSPGAQSKILRFLESGEIQKVGSSENLSADVRILASTNQDLKAMVEERRFRQDLYYRLDVLSIRVPPLRQRCEDIPLLAEHFIREYAKEHGLIKPALSQAAMRRLTAYPWPGNVRQLKHFIERLLIMVRKELIDIEDIQPFFHDSEPADDAFILPFREARQQFERRHISQILGETRGSISRAAELLQMDRANLYRKMKQLGIK